MARLLFRIRRLQIDSPDTSWHRMTAAGLFVVAMVLLVEGFVLRDPREPAPRDIDSSVKRAQTMALADSAFLRQALPYRGRYLDPKQWYLPFVKPFVMRTRTGMQSVFPTVAAAVDVPAELSGGFAAIRLISISAVLMAVFLALRLLHSQADPVGPAVLVLATPLWSYAMGGTSHTVALALMAVALTLAVGRERALATGLMLGLAALIRDEALALAPGLVLVGAWHWRRPKPLLALLAGIVVPIAAVGFLDQQLYGRPAFAHLLHAMRGSLFPDMPSGQLAVLSPLSWQERLDVVLIYWLDGRSRAHLAIVAAAVALAVVVRRRTGSFWGAAPALGIMLFDAGADLLALWQAPRRIPGLLRLAPFVLFALLPHDEASPVRVRRRTIALVLSGVFVLVALATTNTSGGKPLGPRLLLPVWLLLAATAWTGIRGYIAVRGRSVAHAVLAGGGAALVLAGFVLNVGVLMPLYRYVDADTVGAARHLAGSAEDVVIIGSPFAIDPAIAVYPKKTVMLASSAEDSRDIASRLDQARIRKFIFVRRDDRADLEGEFPRYAVARELRIGRWTVQHWSQ